MSMETDIRAKKNEAKCRQLETKVAELEAKIEAMSGPQETGDLTEIVEAAIRSMDKKIDNHREVLLIMAAGLKKLEDKLPKNVSKKRAKKYNNKRKRAA